MSDRISAVLGSVGFTVGSRRVEGLGEFKLSSFFMTDARFHHAARTTFAETVVSADCHHLCCYVRHCCYRCVRHCCYRYCCM